MKLYLSAYKSQAATVVCSRKWILVARRAATPQPTETSNKLPLLVGACFFSSFHFLLFFSFISVSLSAHGAGRHTHTVHVWKAAELLTLLGFKKSLSPHCIEFLSRQKKKKQKEKTQKGFLRFLTLPQECRSRNEDVPHVTRCFIHGRAAFARFVAAFGYNDIKC